MKALFGAVTFVVSKVRPNPFNLIKDRDTRQIRHNTQGQGRETLGGLWVDLRFKQQA